MLNIYHRFNADLKEISQASLSSGVKSLRWLTSPAVAAETTSMTSGVINHLNVNVVEMLGAACLCGPREPLCATLVTLTRVATGSCAELSLNYQQRSDNPRRRYCLSLLPILSLWAGYPLVIQSLYSSSWKSGSTLRRAIVPSSQGRGTTLRSVSHPCARRRLEPRTSSRTED